MSDSNPFSPPRSVVEDGAWVNPAECRPAVRPENVNLAFGMFLLHLGLGFLNLFFNGQGRLAILVFVVLVVHVGMVFAIRAGMNWARVTILILFLIGLPALYTRSRFSLQFGATFPIISVCQTLLQAAALWLVFSKPGSLWFKPVRR